MFCRTDRDGVCSRVDMLDQRRLEAYGLARPRSVLPVDTTAFQYYHYEKRRGETFDNIDGLRSRKRTMATLGWSRRGDKFAAYNELRIGEHELPPMRDSRLKWSNNEVTCHLDSTQGSCPKDRSQTIVRSTP